ncbi:MAG: glycosyltransferase [Candidatus Cryptobacteroides sp.]
MIHLIHIVLIFFLVLPAFYYFIFAMAGRTQSVRNDRRKSVSTVRSRFCILIPAYKSDGYIMQTVRAALNQDYPSDLFKVLVISDSMQEETDRMLLAEGADVLKVTFENSTKAASLSAAADYLGDDAADYVLILDSDNIVRTDFISRMNEVLSERMVAVQGHRCAKNSDTPIALADGVFEEVNNLVFRQGHCALGLSSALVGSGMAFPYKWFRDNAKGFVTAGEDKEMELRLLKDGIFVEYAGDIDILDEKTRSIENLQRQRLRWLRSQYYLIWNAVKEFPQVALKAGYTDKLFQWTFPPRLLVITGLPVMALLTMLAGSTYMSVYITGTLLMFTAIIFGIPKGVKIKDMLSIFKEVPRIFKATVHNILSKKQDKDKFIHTDHQ